MVESPKQFLGGQILPLSPSIQLTTDVSPFGWGTHLGSLTINGLWSTAEASLHIDHFERLAITKACWAFETLLMGQVVQIASDNTTMEFYFNKQTGGYPLASPALPPSQFLGMVLHLTHLPYSGPGGGRGKHPS